MKSRYKFLLPVLTTGIVASGAIFGVHPVLAETKLKVGSEATAQVNAAGDSVIIRKTTYSYDANNDGYIDPSEFNTYITRSVDVDGDGFLETSEYDDSSMTYFYDKMQANQKVENYTFWDKDKDSRLDKGEVDTLVSNRGVYKKWDTNLDGKIDHTEFSAGTFSSYDDNGDGSISKSEWLDVIM